MEQTSAPQLMNLQDIATDAGLVADEEPIPEDGYPSDRRVAFIAGTGSDTARAAGLEMRAVAPIWRYGAARAAAFRAVHRELLTSRRFSVSM